jgi:hypothetical protein
MSDIEAYFAAWILKLRRQISGGKLGSTKRLLYERTSSGCREETRIAGRGSGPPGSDENEDGEELAKDEKEDEDEEDSDVVDRLEKEERRECGKKVDEESRAGAGARRVVRPRNLSKAR